MAVTSRWPFASHGGPTLVRPLLGLSRADTHAYCDARDIAYVDDASNEDARYLRNRVRRELLPALDATSPQGRRAFLRLADEARAGIDAIAQVVAPMVIAGDGGCVRLSRAALRALPSALAPHAYRAALVRLLGDAREFDRRHYDVLARAHAASTGSAFMLPRGVVATVDPDAVVLSIGPLTLPSIDAGIAHALPFAGTLGAWRLDVVASDGADALRLPAASVVRGRRPGDRIQPRGMRGHKSLQDYYVDRKVPRREREGAPVIACGRDVLWTPFGATEPHADAGATYRIAYMRAGRFAGAAEQQV
jgi:tRNA(Ile)-lysidine synthase